MAKKQLSKIVGENITIQRKKLNLTQEHLSEITGIGQTGISRIENGTVIPKFDRLEIIAEALCCEVAELFTIGHHDADNRKSEDEAIATNIAVRLQSLSSEKRHVVLGTINELMRLLKSS